MVFDDIIIGSGLTALATAIALKPSRKILVLAGPKPGTIRYYDQSEKVPRSYMGFGGLGNFWHGIIPMAMRAPYTKVCQEDLEKLFRYFYPRTDLNGHIGAPWLFIPRWPIRPGREWPKLVKARGGNIQLAYVDAEQFKLNGDSVDVITSGGSFRAGHVWVAAGALQTPQLLEASLNLPLKRARVSDHIICYAGQIDRREHPHFPHPQLEHVSEGYWLETYFDDEDEALFMTKPARFGYRALDYGIEHRAAFGLPAANALSKIMQAQSLGLFAEALFNRLGLFPYSSMLSVYSQILIRDAHSFEESDGSLKSSMDSAMSAIARVKPPWKELTRTKRPDLFIKGIHLHHTVDLPMLNSTGLCSEASAVRVVDASVLDDIGPEHHTFYTMAVASKAAREACE